jgi:hypothetical protein
MTQLWGLSRVRAIAFLKRGFWGMMIVTHLPAVWAVWTGLFVGDEARPDPIRLAGLTLTTIFFGLKFADVAWLRFRPGLRSVIALTLVVAILHVGVLGVVPGETLTPQLLAAASSMLFLEPSRWGGSAAALSGYLRRKATEPRHKRSFLALTGRTAPAECVRSPRWILTHTITASRAPPF